jgi:hypothetical protein
MSVANKKVPWVQLEKYLGLHQIALVTFMDQQRHGIMDIPEINLNFQNLSLQLHEAITKILKENDILPKEED